MIRVHLCSQERQKKETEIQGKRARASGEESLSVGEREKVGHQIVFSQQAVTIKFVNS